MAHRNSFILAFLALASCALAGTWLASPGKGSHASGVVGFNPSSVTFDGTNDWITFSGPTMSGAGKTFTISFWVNSDSNAGTPAIIQGRNGGSGPQWRININSLNALNFIFLNAASATVVSGSSDAGITAGGWHHVILSFDTANAASRHIYIDGVAATGGTWATFTADSIPALDRTNLFIGADDGGGSDFGGCLAELWVDDSYIDLSNSANRAKFFNAGDPVDLGAGGATPTGSQPDLFMKFVSGSLGVNSGADGGTGTLTGNVADGDCGAVGN